MKPLGKIVEKRGGFPNQRYPDPKSCIQNIGTIYWTRKIQQIFIDEEQLIVVRQFVLFTSGNNQVLPV